MRDLNKSETRVYKRMCSELHYALKEMQDVKNAVSIFGSARVKKGSKYYKQAYEIALALGYKGYDIITGGGPGIMQAANEGGRDAKVRSIGLNIILPHEQKPNKEQNKSVTFRYFAIRKVCFVKYSKAFVICPGGYGTMDELYEVLTLIQNGGIEKCPIILVGRDYYAGMMTWINRQMYRRGMIIPREYRLLKLVDTVEDVERLIK